MMLTGHYLKIKTHGGGGGEVMTLVVDCKHKECFSCYVEIDVIMGGGGGEVMTLVSLDPRWLSRRR